MNGNVINKKPKWYHRTMVERVIFPLIFSGIALYILVLLKHFGFID